MTEEDIATLLLTLAATRHAALHDPLTGLANRSLILDHLRLALVRAARTSTWAAVVFFDLDGFKQINDTLGHRAGDEVLIRLAERIGPTLRPADTLGRWGGDEFIVVCEDLERVSDGAAIASRIAATLAFPFEVAGKEIIVGASIGVAVSAGTDQPAALIAAADSAMYRVKQNHAARNGTGPGRSVRAAPAELPLHARLTRSLQEVLASLEVDDPLAAQNERVAMAS